MEAYASTGDGQGPRLASTVQITIAHIEGAFSPARRGLIGMLSPTIRTPSQESRQVVLEMGVPYGTLRHFRVPRPRGLSSLRPKRGFPHASYASLRAARVIPLPRHALSPPKPRAVAGRHRGPAVAASKPERTTIMIIGNFTYNQ